MTKSMIGVLAMIWLAIINSWNEREHGAAILLGSAATAGRGG
ncbi:hypothetical protein GGR95_002782 [Sulfitobacter undariae]|uniref:Uncharacterized protein n=1 Tax=Sulfitobacter undariae TaxID=1563671 RepID=A0A7W6H0N8_9RHOB|nr:hypothetical protein [Sulfitobacter undariae]MBB3995131.1 hypothetical protein [Sulfitobacter undariae]